MLDPRCLCRGRVVEVAADRRRRAPKPPRDLLDGQTLRLAVVARKEDGPPTFAYPLQLSHRTTPAGGREGKAAGRFGYRPSSCGAKPSARTMRPAACTLIVVLVRGR